MGLVQRNIAKITVTTVDGSELTFEPKFPVSINIQKGIRKKVVSLLDDFIDEREPNGRETLLIISADDEIRDLVVAASKEIINDHING